MAIPNNYIDKIKNKDSGESRVISPAADMVRVNNENFEGTDLDEVLDEVANAIEEAGSGDGTVTGVKVGSTTYEPTDGVVDLSTPFGGKVDKNGTDSLMTAAEHTKLQNLPTNEQLIQQFGSKANDADVVKSISVNGQAQTPTQGNVNIQVPSGGLTKSDISVETQGDGTVDINVADDTYSINLNHTHENMAKLVVCEESDLPSTLANDTIYGIEDDGEISVLYVGGIPFYGGGGASSGPVLRRPADGSTIDMGETVNGSVSKTINVKGKNLTQALTIELDGTGYTFGNTQPSGVTIVSTTELTVTAEAANALLGVNIVVVYTGNADNAEASLGITSGSPDNISCEATLVANNAVYEDLAGVKFTGTQWLQTDYYPNPNTEFVMQLRFEENQISNTATGSQPILRIDSTTDQRFLIYTGAADSRFHIFCITDKDQNPRPADIFLGVGNSKMFASRATLSFAKGSPGTATFDCGDTYSASLPSVSMSSQTPMAICYNQNSQAIFNVYDLTIFELTITENGDAVRHWVPKTKNGVPGLYDTVNHTFISSETSADLVAIPLTNNN